MNSTRRSFLIQTAAALPATSARTSPDPIWDVHCHLAGVDGDTPEKRASELLRIADRMGIERLVVFMGYPFLADPTAEQLREQNDQVLRALRAFPDRLFGFVYLSPRQVEASLDELERCVRDGPMVGVKLWIAAHCNGPELDPIVERAGSLGAMVYQHCYLKITGNLPGESTPFDVADLARRHPKVPIVCGHAGADWERGIRAIRDCPNVSIDIAGSDPTAGFVEMAVRELGAPRVLFGSDAGGRSFASQLGKVTGAAIPDAAKREILSGSLRRLLGPILKTKGIRA
ncbi:MAG: amidohydrolase family protein [Acidobacteriales bacterium]|nr:amidohydrolase family protein [Terriglobales bacterium]